MKQTAIFILAILISQLLKAQDEKTEAGSYRKSNENIRNIEHLDAIGATGIGFDDRYEGIKGTPLLFDDWNTGNVYLANNILIKNLKVNFNLHDQHLHYVSPANGQILSVPNEKITEVHVFRENRTYIYRKFNTGQFEKSIKPNHFFEVIANIQGKYIFIKQPKKLFRKADFQGAYSADRRYDEFIPDSTYFLTNQNGKFEKIKLNTKFLTKIFPDQKTKIREIVKNNNLSDGEELVIAVLKEL